MRKPRLAPIYCRLLSKVDAYIREHDCRGHQVLSACSDLWDGWLTRDEVEPLVRQKLLYIIPIAAGERRGFGRLIGEHVTVQFTERAARMFWPDRVST